MAFTRSRFRPPQLTLETLRAILHSSAASAVTVALLVVTTGIGRNIAASYLTDGKTAHRKRTLAYASRAPGDSASEARTYDFHERHDVSS